MSMRMTYRILELECNQDLTEPHFSDNDSPLKRSLNDSMIQVNKEPKRVRLGLDKSDLRNGQTKSTLHFPLL